MRDRLAEGRVGQCARSGSLSVQMSLHCFGHRCTGSTVANRTRCSAPALWLCLCSVLCTPAITCGSMFIMAENNPPSNASPSFRSWALHAANPMQSDRLYNVTQLISPPPEETLRRASVSCCSCSVLSFDCLRQSARCLLLRLCWQTLPRARPRGSDAHNLAHFCRKN